jgi:hypothetical protein
MSGVHVTSEAAAFAAEAHDREFVRQLDMFLIASQGKKATRPYLKPILLDRTWEVLLSFKTNFMETNHLVMAMKLCTNSAAVEMVDDLSGPLPLSLLATPSERCPNSGLQ